MIDWVDVAVGSQFSSSRSSERKMSPGVACGELGLQPNNLVWMAVEVGKGVAFDNRDNGADLCGILQF